MFLYVILSCAFLNCIKTMTVIPERANCLMANEKYVSSCTFNVRRYSRKSPYFMNMSGTTKHIWTNNMTVDIILNEYLHNEYRRSFIEFHYKFCDLLSREPYVGGMLKTAGLYCPLPIGPHYLMNMTVPTSNFPNVFPFEKGSADFYISLTSTKEMVMHLNVEMTFKQKLKSGK